MAVTSRKLLFSGPSSKTTRSGTEYTQIWQCITDNALDGPKVLLNYFQSNGPWFNAAYSNGNDYDAFSVVESIDIPQHAAGSANVWEVNVSYKPPDGSGDGGGSRPAPDGTVTDLPWYWNYELSASVQMVSIPLDQARYIAGFTHDPERVKSGDYIPFTNSTLVEKFDPPYEVEQSHLIIKIKSWHKLLNVTEMWGFVNCVNDRPIKLDRTEFKRTGSFGGFPLPGAFGEFGVKGTLPIGTLRVTNFEVAEKREVLTIDGFTDRYTFYEVTTELHCNPDTWDIFVVDRGTMRGALPHEPNGRGGLITYSTPKGGVSAAKIVDTDGLAVGTPVLLDGSGQPQDWSITGATVTRPPTVAPNPVYIQWRPYFHRDLLECPYINVAFKEG